MKILPAIISIIMLLALCAANLFADGPYDEDYVPRVGATPAPPGSGGSVKRGEEWGKQSQATAPQARESSSNEWAPPEKICSRDNKYCVQMIPKAGHPDQWDQCTLRVSSNSRILAEFPTMGYLLDVFYSADNRYVAINNRRANAGDYLWVISLRDGQPLKIPEDVATELGKKELGQISGDHFPPDQAIPEVTALCRDCTLDNLNHPFLFSRDWKSSDELNVVEEFHFFGKGAYGPGASGVWIAVNKVCRITGKGLSLVKRSIEKETQPSDLVKRAWTFAPVCE
jgi:hypothetical protein